GRHSWDVMLMELVSIAFWPNPFVYAYRNAIRTTHEYEADAAVIRLTPWEDYASMLITRKGSHAAFRLSNALIFSSLKKRLVMMSQQPSSMLAKMKYAGILPILVMALIFFSFRGRNEDNSEQPLFPGCDKVNEMEKRDCSQKKLYEYVAQHLKYPESLKASKQEGKVFVKFTVTKNGYVYEPKVMKSLQPDADQAALNVVNSMNQDAGRWTPGTKEGVPVDMDVVLPISFVLGNEGAEQVYSSVEEMPRFPGCENLDQAKRNDCASGKMFQFLADNIKYPDIDKQNSVQGIVFAQFTVQADGQITDITILRGVSPTIDKEVLRVVKAMNDMPEKWIPGRKDGNAVAVQFTLPVKFILDNSQKKLKSLP
ncbi:MAG TPA: M56 family metallopeptidase, partial [Saprospiraceae bacterium]|nr:M56 family metallopeptidase [Saprospiraceae bacterium]